MSLTVIGVLCLVAFLLFDFLRILVKIRTVLGFIGVCIIGTTGWVGHALTWTATELGRLTDMLTGWAFGAAIPVVLLFVLVVFVAHDMHPKKSASRRTGWLAIALAAVLVAGVSGLKAANDIPASVRNGVTNAKTDAMGW
jgi:hypothetical protein